MSTLTDLISRKLQDTDIVITEDNRPVIEALIDKLIENLKQFQIKEVLEEKVPSEPELYTELELKLMTVKQLQKILKENSLKVPRLKADMVQILLENRLGKDNLLHPEVLLEPAESPIFEISESPEESIPLSLISDLIQCTTLPLLKSLLLLLPLLI